jgi:antitoxin VapB
MTMRTTKVFQSGNSQAVRLPKDFQLHSDKVEIFRKNGDIVLREIPQNLVRAFELLTQMPNDFFENGREDMPPQDREF